MKAAYPGVPMPEPHAQKRRWRNIMLDVRYQISFALPVVLVSAALFAGLGYIAMRKVDSATKISLNQIELTNAVGLENAAAMKDELLERERTLRFGIVGVGILLSSGLFLFALVMSHRVAGPLHRLEAELNRLGSGSFGPPRDLRMGDLLADFYRRFGLACATLQQSEQLEVAALNRVVHAARLDPAWQNSEALALFSARLRAKEQGLG
jgi:hypothetical protein